MTLLPRLNKTLLTTQLINTGDRKHFVEYPCSPLLFRLSNLLIFINYLSEINFLCTLKNILL